MMFFWHFAFHRVCELFAKQKPHIGSAGSMIKKKG
jgi:hypothetical protein